MIIMYCMCVRVGTSPTPLEIFATNKTTVNVDVRKRYGTDFLEVEVENGSVDLRAGVQCRLTERTCRLTVSR